MPASFIVLDGTGQPIKNSLVASITIKRADEQRHKDSNEPQPSFASCFLNVFRKAWNIRKYTDVRRIYECFDCKIGLCGGKIHIFGSYMPFHLRSSFMCGRTKRKVSKLFSRWFIATEYSEFITILTQLYNDRKFEVYFLFHAGLWWQAFVSCFYTSQPFLPTHEFTFFIQL